MPDPNVAKSVTDWGLVLGPVLGGLATGLVAFGMNWVNKKSEERKHQQELVFNAAIESWKKTADIASEQVKSGAAPQGEVAPLDSFIIHMMKLSELITDKKITKENVSSIIKESLEVSSEVKRCQEEQYKKFQSDQP